VIYTDTFGQVDLTGKYVTAYGDILLLHNDSTFKYSNCYPRPEWAIGKWKVRGKFIYLECSLIYDTLCLYDNNGLIEKSLVLSGDQIPNAIKKIKHNSNIVPKDEILDPSEELSQSCRSVPSKLFHRNKYLLFLDNRDKPIKKKGRSIFTNKKIKPGFIKEKSSAIQ
jgi:hypothetical protein